MSPWHVPVLVTAVVILSEFVVYLAARSLKGVAAHRLAGVTALTLFAAIAVLGVTQIGPDRTNDLAGIVSAVLAAVAIWLAYESYRANQPAKRRQPPEENPPPATDSDSPTPVSSPTD